MAGEARMSRPDEGLIHAWLDGELEPVEAARVQKLAASDPEWMAAVAEARGLIAASSRIVRALDAVPGGVLPSRTARAPMAARGFRVRPWMGMAAGLVLVVGTAYVMRESTEDAFGPTTTAGGSAASEVGAAAPPPTSPASAPTTTTTTMAAPANAPATAPATAPTPPPADAQAGALASARSDAVTGERREAVAPLRDQPVGPVQQASDDLRRSAAGAGSTRALPELPSRSAPVAIAPPAPAPALAPPRAPSLAPSPAAKTAAEEDRSLSRLRSNDIRLGQVVVTGAAEAAAPRDATAAVLAGCWRATAPDSLAALYRDLAIVRTAGDTLEVVLPNTRTVLVIRDRDTLRGGLTAVREVCPARPE